jgi:hypothetical protein
MLNRLFKLSTLLLTATLIFMNIPVSAQGDTTVEGDTTRFVTGEVYASQIEVAGYNTRTGEVYLNLEFTSKDTNITTLNYDVKIFDNTQTIFGSKLQDTLTLETAALTTTSQVTYNVGANALTSQYSTVVTVTKLNN